MKLRANLTSVLVIFVMTCAYAPGLSASMPAFEAVAELLQPCVNMAASPNGGVLLLTENQNLLDVDLNGTVRRRSLPPLPAEAEAETPADLAVVGERVFFLLSQPALLLSMDFASGQKFESAAITGLKGEERPSSLVAWGNGLLCVTTAGRAYRLGTDGVVGLELPAGTLGVSSPTETPFQLSVSTDPSQPASWALEQAGKGSVFSYRSADFSQNAQNLRFLGQDAAGRLYLLVTVGPGEQTTKTDLLVVKDGNIESTTAFPDTGLLPMSRSYVVLPNGTVFAVTAETETETETANATETETETETEIAPSAWGKLLRFVPASSDKP